MFRLSGAAIVIAGLATVGVAYVAWNWDTTVFRGVALRAPASAPVLQGEAAGALVLHSAAWRALHVDEPAPKDAASATVAPLPPRAPTAAKTQPAVAKAQPALTAVPPAMAVAPAGETKAEPAVAKDEPSVAAAADAPEAPSETAPVARPEPRPSPRGRMSLAGPEGAPPKPAAGVVARHAPTRHAHPEPVPAPNAQPAPVVPTPPKFGPDSAFKGIDGVGF